MEAKEVGMLVKDFAEKLVDENVKVTVDDLSVNTTFIDNLGSALLLQGAMLLLTAGCPHEYVLRRVIGCIESYLHRQAAEALESDIATAGAALADGPKLVS